MNASRLFPPPCLPPALALLLSAAWPLPVRGAPVPSPASSSAPAPAAAPAVPARLDVYVSTGDNHFLGSSLPIDSPASIAVTFDLFRDVQRARRVYWRGLEEACWLRTMTLREENPRYASLWRWMQELYAAHHPDILAVKAAHERGMEIWGVGSLWDWGAPADTPGFGDYPFAFESRLRLEHPEWSPADRHGVRRQGGPIELAYPEARQALVQLITEETFRAGYDGITFLTYVENYSLRFQDEFGYSDPIVQDFRKRHGIDLRRESFRRGASREDWMRLRGTYVTAFLRELRAALAARGVKLGMIVNSNDPRQPQSWNVPQLMLTAGRHHMDVDTWVREGLVDALLIYGNNSPAAVTKAIEDLRWLARGTSTEVSFMTSSPFGEGWRPCQADGVPTVLAVSDDAQHLERGFVPAQTKEALRASTLPQRLRALQQAVAGQLSATVEELRPGLASPNLIERRLTLQALGKSKSPEAVPLLEAGLNDPENGVRCLAALALGETHGADSGTALLQAVARHGNHMLRECAIIALRRLKPLPVGALREAALQSPSGAVREAATRTLLVHASPALIPVFRQALQDADRFPRFAAAEALGNLPASPEAVEILLAHLGHADPAVANRCAVSLGKIAAAGRPETASLQPRIEEGLLAAFRRHGDSGLPDAEWGWRPVGNALLSCGPEGAAALRRLRDQRENFRLAELAWRVVDLRQCPNTFSEVTEPENEAAIKLRPQPPRSLRVDPAQGNDANDGESAPVKSIARALALAGPGDTVHLTPGRYREPIVFSNMRGEPDRPIILDGHGAVLDGAEPLDPPAWTQVEPGLYRHERLLPMNAGILSRWFFVWEGRMNRMGRVSKGPKAELKAPAALQPGEWTYVPDAPPEARESPSGKPWDAVALPGAFYLRIDPARTLADHRIEAPLRANGVSFAGLCAHLLIRNVTATHFYNDGFNIHGDQAGLVFENIAAMECGDDGFSAHEAAECRIDGFTSIGNATGLCDVGASRTSYRNVLIRDCLGVDVDFVSHGEHRLENALVQSSAARSVTISRDAAAPDGVCAVHFRNVRVQRASGSPQEIRVDRGGRLQAEQCTFANLAFQATPGSSVSLLRCWLTGDPKPGLLIWKETAWSGSGNHYDLGSLRLDQESFTAATFPAFQAKTGSETDSRWAAGQPQHAGADEAALPPSEP